MSQFGFLDTMQKEIDAAGWPVPVVILGVNAVGQESGNAYACAGKDIPWLQDTVAQDVWGKWGVAWRDLVILDRDNVVVDVVNLTTFDLADSTNYAVLRDKLRVAAGGEAAP